MGLLLHRAETNPEDCVSLTLPNSILLILLKCTLMSSLGNPIMVHFSSPSIMEDIGSYIFTLLTSDLKSNMLTMWVFGCRYINTALYPFTSIFLTAYCFLPAVGLFTNQFIVINVRYSMSTFMQSNQCSFDVDRHPLKSKKYIR